MHLKLILATSAVCALSLGIVLAQEDGYCYDAEQHAVKFSDLGSRLDITQALNETCGTPIGDHMYACNAAKVLNVPMPNNASHTFVFHFATLHYVNQSIPDTGPCGGGDGVYLSRASCVYLGLAAIDTCERGGEVTISETVSAGGGAEDGKPVTAWVQVIPYV